MSDFKEQLESNFIPRIKEMIDKEREHYKYLSDAGYEFQSKQNITILKLRLQQYIDYAAKL